MKSIATWPFFANKKGALILCALVGPFVLAIWLLDRQTPEPTYQGKKLSVWIEEASSRQSVNREVAQNVIRVIGTNAIPWLLFQFSSTEPKWIDWRSRWQSEQPFAGHRYYDKRNRVHMSALGLYFLGDGVSSALPVLRPFLAESRRGFWAAKAMSGARDEALPYFVDGILDTNYTARMSSIAGISRLLESGNCISEVLDLLKHPDKEVRRAAAANLCAATSMHDSIVAALALSLSDSDASVRRWAAMSLGSFGRISKPAIEKLVILTEDKEPEVIKAAEAAILRIRSAQAPEDE